MAGQLLRFPLKARHFTAGANTIRNEGSAARDHLANERTFLAWARTGMTFVGLGVAIDSLQQFSVPEPDGGFVAQEEDVEAKTGQDRWREFQAHAPSVACIGTGDCSAVQHARLSSKGALEGLNNL